MIQLSVLNKIYQRLVECGVNWALTGSLGFWLQGVDLEVHDIDIQTDKVGAYAIENVFLQYLIKPVAFSSSGRIRSHYGILRIDGVDVEIMGDIQKREADGSWEKPVDITRYIVFVELEEMQIPVLSLEYEYEAYMKLGRIEKAEVLKRCLDSHRK